jgi:hypothetical protein
MKDFAATFVVSSESSKKLRAAKRLIIDRARVDSLDVDVAKAADRVKVQYHRIGDYFSSIDVADSGPTSFRVVFVPRSDADLYWKDLVVRILLSVRDSGVLVRAENRSQH